MSEPSISTSIVPVEHVVVRTKKPYLEVKAALGKLMDLLPGKAISSVPKLANRTPIAFVIDSFLVRAADYAVGHRDGQHSMLLDKFQYLPGDTRVGTDVTVIHFPIA